MEASTWLCIVVVISQRVCDEGLMHACTLIVMLLLSGDAEMNNSGENSKRSCENYRRNGYDYDSVLVGLLQGSTFGMLIDFYLTLFKNRVKPRIIKKQYRYPANVFSRDSSGKAK